jgi:hypothetical protein
MNAGMKSPPVLHRIWSSVITLHHPALLGNDFGVHGGFFDSLNPTFILVDLDNNSP